MRLRPFRFAAVAAAALLLGACSTDTALDDVGTLWGEPSSAELEAEQLQEAIEARVPVQTVRAVEIGRTADGFLITAFGTAPGLGHALPSLRARHDGAPGTDGYIEYDLVALPPDPASDLPSGTARIRQVRADLPIGLEQTLGTRGVRVFALEDRVQADF